MKRTVPSGSSITCSASAGSSARRVDARRDELRRRQPRVRGREHERLARRAGEAVESGGDELLQPLGNRQRLRRIADAPVGAERPRELERVERVPARDLVQPEQRRPRRPAGRAGRRRSRWIAPTLSGPTRNRSIRSGSSALLDRRRPARPRRAAASRRAGSVASGSRRSANPSALADEASSHWRSSIATTSSPSSGEQLAARSEPRHRAPAGRRPDCRTHPRPAARPRAPAAGAAVRAGSTSSRASSNRSPRPACASPRSDSAGREESTRNPRARADVDGGAARASTCRSRPRPRARSRSGLAGARRSRNAYSEPSSSSLPTTSTAIVSPPRSAPPGRRAAGRGR